MRTGARRSTGLATVLPGLRAAAATGFKKSCPSSSTAVARVLGFLLHRRLHLVSA